MHYLIHFYWWIYAMNNAVSLDKVSRNCSIQCSVWQRIVHCALVSFCILNALTLLYIQLVPFVVVHSSLFLMWSLWCLFFSMAVPLSYGQPEWVARRWSPCCWSEGLTRRRGTLRWVLPAAEPSLQMNGARSGLGHIVLPGLGLLLGLGRWSPYLFP